MAAPVITISSDISKESTRSVASRVILFGTIPTEIPIVPDIPTNLPSAPELHVDDVVSRWRDRVRFRPSFQLGSSSPNTTIPSTEIPVALTPPAPSTEIATASTSCISTPIIIVSPAIRSHIRTTARKSTLGLRPVMTPTRSAALSRARRASLSLETSSSDTSFGTSSDSTPHTSESSFTASLQGTQISLEDYSHHSFKAIHSPSGPLTPTSISSTVHTAGALSPTRADLLPPRKRYRDIKAEIAAATTTAVVTVDRLDTEPVMVGAKTDFETGLEVIESESELEEAKADEETDAEIQPKGQLEEGMQEHVVTLEGSNTKLRDALGIERVRADSLQRRLSYVEDVLRQVRELRAYESQRLWRMETFMMGT
ncbi:hypothetical protein Tco_0708814 [Tanacetum coccineum]